MPDEPVQTPVVEDASGPTFPEGTDSTPEHDLDAPADSRPSEESVDYRKRYSESTKEFQRLQREREQERQQYAHQINMLNWQLSQIHQQARPPAPQQAPPPANNELLTKEEKEAFKQAVDTLDTEKQLYFQQLGWNRAAEKAKADTYTNLALMADQAHRNNQVLTEIQSAPEWQDKAASEVIWRRVAEYHSNPKLAAKVPYGQINFNGVSLNPYAIERALVDYRAQAKVERAQTRANDSAYVDLGNQPASSAHAGGSSSFNPQTHLSSNERQTLKQAVSTPIGRRWYGDSIESAYRSFWKKLPEAERKRRAKEGARSNAPRSHFSATAKSALKK